jgi:para-nitrobenzyl esterase
MQPRTLEEAERIGMQADDLLKAGGNVETMRRASIPALLAIDQKLHDSSATSDVAMWMRTTVDGKLFPADPRTLLEQAPPRPVIIGNNLREFGVDREQRDEAIARAFGPNEAAARAFYHADRPNPPDAGRLGSLDDQIGTDIVFRCPAETLAQLLSAKGAPVYRYEFDSAPNGGLTSHAAEIPYAFSTSTFAPGQSLKPYWINFARTGDPNGAAPSRWPRFTPDNPQHVRFDSKGVTVEAALHPQLCAMENRL